MIPLLGTGVAAATGHEIPGQCGEGTEGTGKIAFWGLQDDFIAAAEDFDFVHAKLKLFWQANRLAIAGLKYSGRFHIFPFQEVYTSCIY
jgi:hypothetical protein